MTGRPHFLGAAARLAALFVAATAACAEEPAPAAAVPEPPVEARTGVDKAIATTGDVITYEVVVEHQADIDVNIPDPGDRIAGFRIVDLGRDPPVTRDGRVIERRWYELRADLVGSYVLPPVRVTYRLPEGAAPDAKHDAGEPPPAEGVQPSPQTQAPAVDAPETLSTSEIFVEVQTVLPADGSATDIRDIKPLEEMKRDPPWIWIGAGLVLLLAGLVAGLFWLRQRRRAVVISAAPPHEIAFAALGNLRKTDFDDPVALRRYYFSLSEVVRAYVEGRFALNATDLTTEEIRRALEDLEDLDPPIRALLEGFLHSTDHVKFAGHAPTHAEIGETYEQALSFVEKTAPRPQEAA